MGSGYDDPGGGQCKLVRQSQIVQSVMQDCQYILSHLLPVCSLLVQAQI